MPEVVLLDAGPLGMVAHPRPTEEILAWLGRLLAGGVEVLIAEIADYEVRREFWAEARRRGRPTAHEKTLDADAILAGQAATLYEKEVVVATANPRHLARFVAADRWQAIKP
jgi:hypothetical protein